MESGIKESGSLGLCWLLLEANGQPLPFDLELHRLDWLLKGAVSKYVLKEEVLVEPLFFPGPKELGLQFVAVCPEAAFSWEKVKASVEGLKASQVTLLSRGTLDVPAQFSVPLSVRSFKQEGAH